MVEDANKYAVSAEEAANNKSQQSLSDAVRNRRELIEAATTEGAGQGKTEAEQMKANSTQAQQEMKNAVAGKIDSAAGKILDSIKAQG